jgi:hypothetical protein
MYARHQNTRVLISDGFCRNMFVSCQFVVYNYSDELQNLEQRGTNRTRKIVFFCRSRGKPYFLYIYASVGTCDRFLHADVCVKIRQ